MTTTRALITTALAAALTFGIAAPATADSRPAPRTAPKVAVNGWSLSVIDGQAFGWYIVRNATRAPKTITVMIRTGSTIALTRTHTVPAFDDAYVTITGEPVTPGATGPVTITATR